MIQRYESQEPQEPQEPQVLEPRGRPNLFYASLGFHRVPPWVQSQLVPCQVLLATVQWWWAEESRGPGNGSLAGDDENDDTYFIHDNSYYVMILYMIDIDQYDCTWWVYNASNAFNSPRRVAANVCCSKALRAPGIVCSLWGMILYLERCFMVLYGGLWWFMMVYGVWLTMQRKTLAQACEFWIIVIYAGVVTCFIDRHLPRTWPTHVSKYSFESWRIWHAFACCHKF